ncbi:hypothetical protein RND81_04G162400 [Saponaria officinalis]|uniref:Copper transport protein n=1 Tax=Saponaria officinalis TaxID=3572 RepID=A0AAW1LLC4_SAPOF
MNMGSMNMTSSPSPSSPMMMRPKRRMMMHMTFYWGSDALILFRGWPGTSLGMYLFALVVVLVLALVQEFLSRSTIISTRVGNGPVSGLLKALLHAARMGVAYLVMLAVMSFNVGVFIAAVVGHALGFFLASRVFGSGDDHKGSDVGPMSC